MNLFALSRHRLGLEVNNLDGILFDKLIITVALRLLSLALPDLLQTFLDSGEGLFYVLDNLGNGGILLGLEQSVLFKTHADHLRQVTEGAVICGKVQFYALLRSLYTGLVVAGEVLQQFVVVGILLELIKLGDKLARETIVRDIDTRLCSRHFRNELYLFKKDHYDTFVQIAQSTWPGLRINSLDYDTYENKLNLYVYDAEYSAEIGLMGSGLQMWLQMVWFISRCSPDSTIVLDEPDVYMHPDLQRKIYKIVTSRFKQVIIATHSVEIISAAEPYQIVTIDKTTRKMQYANNYKAVQSVIANLGSEHNLSLTRLGNAKKCVFVEGNDVKTLVRLQAIVDPQYQVPIDHVPSVSLGGWTRFNEALGAARLFYEETNGEIETYCILDHDYHTEEEIRNLYAKADESHLTLHVWSKKEIENYLITPESVFRLMGLEENQRPEFLDNFFKLTDQLYQSTLTATMDYLSSIDRSKTAGVIMKMAADILTPSWSTLEGRLSVVNGKELMSLVNSWLRNQHKVKSSRDKLIKALTPDDISQEIKDVINLLTKQS